MRFVKFTVYNRNTKGSCVVTGTDSNGTEAPLFSTVSVTQSRKALGDYKKSTNHMRVRTDTILDCGWEGESAAPVTPMSRVGEAVSQSINQTRTQPQQRFTLPERFEMMEEVVDMIANGDHKSMLVCGNGGSGKTHTILDRLHHNGMSRVEVTPASDAGQPSEEDEEEAPAVQAIGANQYVKVSGAVSPMGLYEILYTYSNCTIVFDDSDSVFATPVAVNILKGVLDTTGDGEVTWNSPAITRAGLPTSFIFSGKVIFISNKQMNSLPQALLSRAFILDMDANTADILARARQLDAVLMPTLTVSEREEVFTFAEENLYEFKDFSLRTFVKIATVRRSGSKNWQKLSLFTN